MKRIFKRRFISLILAAAMTVGTGYMPNAEGVEIGFTSPVMAETATEYTSTDTSTSTTESSTETTTEYATEATTDNTIEYPVNPDELPNISGDITELPFKVTDYGDVRYNLDKAYTGKVKVTINFTTNNVVRNGNFLVLRSSGGIECDAAIRIIGGETCIGRSEATAIPSNGSLVVGDNTVAFVFDTDTGEITATVNGVATTHTNNSNYVLTDVGVVKFNYKSDRTTVVTDIKVEQLVNEETSSEDTTETTAEVTTTEATWEIKGDEGEIIVKAADLFLTMVELTNDTYLGAGVYAVVSETCSPFPITEEWNVTFTDGTICASRFQIGKANTNIYLDNAVGDVISITDIEKGLRFVTTKPCKYVFYADAGASGFTGGTAYLVNSEGTIVKHIYIPAKYTYSPIEIIIPEEGTYYFVIPNKLVSLNIGEFRLYDDANAEFATESTTAGTIKDTTETTTEVTTEATNESDTALDFIWGDVNGDGIVGGEDSCDVIEYALDPSLILTNPRAADVNGDGIIGAKDAAMIFQYEFDCDFIFPAISGVEDTTEGTTDPAKIVKVQPVAPDAVEQDGRNVVNKAIGDTFNVNIELSNVEASPGLASYSFFVTYDPDVVRMTGLVDPPSEDGYMTYAMYISGMTIHVVLVPVSSTVANSIALAPVGNDALLADYGDVITSGMSATTTCGELGKVKFANCITFREGDQVATANNSGILMTLSFEVVGSGDTRIYVDTENGLVDGFGAAPMATEAFNAVSMASNIYVQNVSSEADFEFDSATGTITGYNGAGGAVVIPSSIGGVAVTAIGDNAFDSCDGITSISLPEGLISIGEYSFARCAGLTSVIIPEGVTSIGDGAFYVCSSLESIHMPNSVTSMGQRAFRLCKNLTSITLSDNITAIERYTFYGCSGLTEIVIPKCVTTIDVNAFENCSSLEKVTLPEGLTSVGQYAFDSCSKLSEITIPNSVTTIDKFAFLLCGNLTDITIPGGVDTISQGVFSQCTNLTNVKIEEGVTTIDINAFDDCANMTSLSIPSSVTTINGTFGGSSGIKTAGPIGSGCDYEFGWTTSIPDNAFAGFSGLVDITIPEGITTLGAFVFLGCAGLTNVTIPSSVTNIGQGAFEDCSSLAEIVVESENQYYTVSDNILYSRDMTQLVFCPASKIGEVTIPGTVTKICDYAFYNCSGLTGINIPSSVNTIGEYAFYGCSGLTDISIPNSVTDIGMRAFAGCTGLTEILVPSSVTSLGHMAFGDCTNLVEANIEGDLTSVGNGLFQRDGKLEKVTLPRSMTIIGNWTFNNCSSLTEIQIPDSVTYIGQFAFSNCVGLREVIIPNNVATIDRSAFAGCTVLTEIIIPDSVTTIGRYAFNYCNELVHVYFAGSEDQWAGIEIYDYNDPLTSATIHYNASAEDMTVTTEGTTETTSEATTEIVTAPVEETSTADSTEATSETVTETGTETTTETTTDFDGVYPVEGGNIYYNEEGVITGADKDIVIDEIPYTIGDTKITAIGDNAFAGCENLTEVNILNNITSIGENAFGDCVNLTGITLTGSTTAIAGSAVSGSVLATVTVVEGTYGETWANDKGYTVEHKTFLYGDANYDGILGAQDAVNILQKVLDNSFPTGMDKNGGNTSLYLDTNGDGVVGAQDAAITLQKVLDNSYRMPCELK